MFGIDDLFNFGSSALSYFGQQSTNNANRNIARETNAFNAQEAAKNRQFQADMSNTAYQRAVADMNAAGLNPILLTSKGFPGESTPGGSAATGQTGAPQLNQIGAAVSTAMDAMRMRAELKNLSETNKKIQSDTDLNKSMKLVADTDRKIKSSTAQIVASQVPGAKKEQEIDNSKFGTVMRYLGRMNPFANTGVSLLKAVK